MQPCEQKEKIEKIDAVLLDISVRLGVIDERLKSKVSDIDKHILDGEARGGWRDRLVIVENKVENSWKFAVVAGILGGLIGSGAPNAVVGIAKLLGV